MDLQGITPGDDNHRAKKYQDYKNMLQNTLGGTKINISFSNTEIDTSKNTLQKNDDIPTLLAKNETTQTTTELPKTKSYNSIDEKAREDFQQKIKEQPKEEYSTEELTEEQINEYMQLFGKTREEVIADHKKTIKQFEEWNKQLSNTKASNGMTLPEAKRAYMEIYDKYIKKCGVRVPWVIESDSARQEGIPDGRFVGGVIEDVDPSQIESKMTPADRELFEKAKAAIAELEQNEKLMEAYQFSETANLERTFNTAHIFEGQHLATWQSTAEKWGVNPEDEISRNQRVRPWF